MVWECKEEKGYCLKPDGDDQQNGVQKLSGVDIKTEEEIKACNQMCMKVKGVTACEKNWGLEWRGCYAHTMPVAKGSGKDKHVCSLASSCKQVPEQGNFYCEINIPPI